MKRLLLWCFCVLASSGVFVGSEAVRVVVPEGDEALLPCSLSTKEDLTLKLFDWRKDGQKEVFMYEAGSHYNDGRQGQDKQFKGRVSYFEDKLKNGDASIKIIKTEVADSGNYTCDFPRHQPPQTFLIELVVGLVLRDRSGEISGAAKPSVKTLHKTETWALLLCEVLNARPEPTVMWQDSTGNKLPADQSGDRFNVILHATVTKTDNYRCVVTQEEINHQAASKIYVRLSGACTGGIVAGVLASLITLMVVVLVLVVLHLKGCDKCSRPRPSKKEEEEEMNHHPLCEHNSRGWKCT